MTAWNDDELEYETNEIQRDAAKILTQLYNIAQYTDNQLLHTSLFKQDFESFVNLDRFLYCSGGYSFPITVEKIPTQKFSEVFFVNSHEGNGGISLPDKLLVIRNNKDWLIVDEQPQLESLENYYPDCPQGFPSEYLPCMIDTWEQKYRNTSEEKMWVEEMLQRIEVHY